MASNRTSNLVKGTNLFKVFVNIDNNQMHISKKLFFFLLPPLRGCFMMMDPTTLCELEIPSYVSELSALQKLLCWVSGWASEKLPLHQFFNKCI